MRCPSCDSENPGTAKFCVECGAAFKGVCPKCGSECPPSAKFCAECGTSIKSVSKGLSSSNSATIAIQRSLESSDVEGERKTVTALFADIKGSTELMEDLDPEEARAIVDPALKLMIETVRHYEGYVVQSTGDGIFALFGAPLAHEDHPQRALYAALRMQHGLREYEAKLKAHGRMSLEARVG